MSLSLPQLCSPERDLKQKMPGIRQTRQKKEWEI
jgi:hypothetical protein